MNVKVVTRAREELGLHKSRRLGEHEALKGIGGRLENATIEAKALYQNPQILLKAPTVLSVDSETI